MRGGGGSGQKGHPRGCREGESIRGAGDRGGGGGEGEGAECMRGGGAIRPIDDGAYIIIVHLYIRVVSACIR